MGQLGWARAQARWVLVSGFGIVLGATSATARADDRAVVVSALPDSPGQAVAQAAAQAAMATGRVSGMVLDSNGKPVPGAKVRLSQPGGKQLQVTESDTKGEFVFNAVDDGALLVTVMAPGLETFISDEIHMMGGEPYELPRIALPLAPVNADVTVSVTQDQLATEQVHEQEKQRVLGVIPNFYTSFLWDAAPMHTKQKAQLAYRSAIDPEVFAVTAIRATEQQLKNTDPGYGTGAAGFARRFGAAYGDSITGRLVGLAILPALFRQDPRYFYRGSGSVPGRLWYALTRAVVTRGDNGKDQPNYSHVLGNFASAGLRNLYLDPDDRKGVDVVLNGLVFTAYNAATNVVREFISRPLSTHVPDYKKGRPETAK